MVEKLAVHIPPDANPTNITDLICYLYSIDYECDTLSQIIDLSREANIGSRVEMTAIASLMGFFDKSENRIRLSSLGNAFAALNPELRGDVLHWLMYSGWSESNPLIFLPSWSYRQICNRLWDLGIQKLDSSFLDGLVTEMVGLTEKAFRQMGVSEFSEISFSRKSLTGAIKWLEAMNPPVLEDNLFQRRDFCEPAIMLLAFSYALRDDPDALQVNVLLSDELKEELCRVCLLDPDYFDPTLDWMLPLYSDIITADPEVGYYGRYVRLQRLPSIEDLLR